MEVKCHDRAFRVVAALAKSKEPLLSVSLIQALHKICMPPRIDNDDPIPGLLKTAPNMAVTCHPRTGELCTVDFVAPEDVPRELQAVVDWCNQHAESCSGDLVRFLTILHYAFIRVHPFADTNGRTVRLLMNLYLLRYGYPPFWIDPAERPEYLQALALANFEDDLLPLAKFIGRSMVQSYRRALEELRE